MSPKLIAFHLPQFHPIPENDAWWGKGFTEWTNVTRATPRFPGHHQPQLPADLGFYDLRLPEARAAQAELAREYGIHGFCYYHYWFNGKRLLERPVEEILASGEPDFPFCLCWANENWTRRWDGAEQEVLIAQHYNDDDDRAHIRYLIPFFRDPRYIRIDGKPLMLIYRARHLPDPKRSLAIWRNEARKAGVGELFICRVENFFNERDDPHTLGFDASVDFQPDWKAITEENPSVVLPDEHFVIDYSDLVDAQLERPEVAHLRFPGVTPSWDNSARRRKNAFIIADSSPEAYEHWLAESLQRIRNRPESQQLVFINAWNEWAEGNHLEPDQKFGHAYLEATRRALEQAISPDDLKRPPLTDPLRHHGFAIRQHYLKHLAAQRIGKAAAQLHDERLAGTTPPHIHLVLDATRCGDEALSRSLKAISGQLYEHWHLDVLSIRPAPQVASSRLGWHTLAPEQASQAAAELISASNADRHAVLVGGDILAEDALLFAAQHVIDHPDCPLILTDGDTRAADGSPVRTWLAPGMNPDWLRSTLRIGGAVIAGQAILLDALRDIGDSPCDALALAAVLRALESPITPHHLPRIALSHPDEQEAIPLAFRADLLTLHLARLGQAATLKHALIDDACHVNYEHAGPTPAVAVLLGKPASAEDILRTVQGVLARADGFPASILLPRTADAPPSVRDCLAQLAGLDSPNIRILDVADARPSAVFNPLAEAATAPLLLLLDCGLMPLDDGWLQALAGHARRPGIGAVGGRIVAPDGSLCEGLVRLGQGGIAGSPYLGISANYTGNGGELHLEQNCVAVSGRCLMVARTVFLEAGGFRTERYPETHTATDLCLRLHKRGLRHVWTPHATLAAPGTVAPRPFAPPTAADAPLLDDWLREMPADPYANRQLSHSGTRPRLQFDLALAHDPLPWHPRPRIYAHPADLTGCGEMRILAPMRALARAGLIQGNAGTRFLGPWNLAALAADTVVTQRVHTDMALEWLNAYRRHRQGLLIYELDDLLGRISRDNELGKGFPADIEARVTRAIGLCDRLVVSTEPLAAAYGRHAAETVVAPNLLDDAVWGPLRAQPNDSPRLRVGWAGSASHGGDLTLLEEVIRATATQVDWVFMGFCPPALKSLLREVHPPVAVKDYPAALAGLRLDVAVAPLAANAFNEAKSNLKLLEYGALGYPVVCSNILPYQGGLPVVRVANTPQQWLSALRRLLADREERETLGTALREAVRANWMIDARRAEWLAAWTR
ncbi:glycoside hydrolase family 99-like domain-containing protein [Thauera butanivorans]|uniref:glycoside hydrolase family 99-like domain-containing protein n=1 Tax=Thauera butanivorans TaxID=86174 RepID=UPI000A04EAB2|nr:glycoside hydrolase family 99-like domain-containing protein [Thauera butanivorans]